MDERIDLHRWCPPWVKSQHLARYRWACQFAGRQRVIDAACGTGYGTDLLSVSAASVMGIDADAATILAAKIRFPSLTFWMGDLQQLPLENETADLVVSFETIEHVANDRRMLSEVRRVLAPDGTFLCSTPNRLLVHPGSRLHDRPLNPFHVREYAPAEFRHLLRDTFSTVRLYGQTRVPGWYASLLPSIGRLSPTLAARCHQAWKLFALWGMDEAIHWPMPLEVNEHAEILIAVCR